MDTQGIKSVYADPCLICQTTMFVLPLGTVDAATSLSKTSLWESLSLPCNNRPPSILVKTMDPNESYGNTMVITA